MSEESTSSSEGLVTEQAAAGPEDGDTAAADGQLDAALKEQIEQEVRTAFAPEETPASESAVAAEASSSEDVAAVDEVAGDDDAPELPIRGQADPVTEPSVPEAVDGDAPLDDDEAEQLLMSEVAEVAEAAESEVADDAPPGSAEVPEEPRVQEEAQSPPADPEAAIGGEELKAEAAADAARDAAPAETVEEAAEEPAPPTDGVAAQAASSSAEAQQEEATEVPADQAAAQEVPTEDEAPEKSTAIAEEEEAVDAEERDALRDEGGGADEKKAGPVGKVFSKAAALGATAAAFPRRGFTALLDLVNKPFAGVDDETRDLLGWIAIGTLAIATGILVLSFVV